MDDKPIALAMWRAIQNTAPDEPLPKEVRAYLLKAADTLFALVYAREEVDHLKDPPVTKRDYALRADQVAEKVPFALGLDGNDVKRWRNKWAAIDMAIRFESTKGEVLEAAAERLQKEWTDIGEKPLKSTKYDTVNAAVEQFAEDEGISESTVHRARRLVPDAVKREIAHTAAWPEADYPAGAGAVRFLSRRGKVSKK